MALVLSEQLRRRRKALGLSLGKLARRVDTSAATLSRYESGWTRFELYTLKKLAVALKCDLRMELVPSIPRRRSPPSKQRRLRQLQRLFWDHKLSMVDLEKYPVWVVERVLEYGQLQDVLALQELYGRNNFLQLVTESSRLSERTAAFWSAMLKKEGLKCTKKFSRPKAWNY